jgi:hypothetical protein
LSGIEDGPSVKSYIVAFDGGTAPNPYHDVCSLALCKPDIRRTSEVGDLIIGLTGITLGYRLVYAMYVSEILPLGDYFTDQRFQLKKPDFKSADHRDWMGDNIYERIVGEEHIQHPSYFNLQDRSQTALDKKMKTDLTRGKHVLLSDKFWYFGHNSSQLPQELDFLHERLRRGHRVYSEEAIGKFEKFASHLLKSSGIQGEPRDLSKRAKQLEYLHES